MSRFDYAKVVKCYIRVNKVVVTCENDSAARPTGRECGGAWRPCHPAGPPALTLQAPPPGGK